MVGDGDKKSVPTKCTTHAVASAGSILQPGFWCFIFGSKQIFQALGLQEKNLEILIRSGGQQFSPYFTTPLSFKPVPKNPFDQAIGFIGIPLFINQIIRQATLSTYRKGTFLNEFGSFDIRYLAKVPDRSMMAIGVGIRLTNVKWSLP